MRMMRWHGGPGLAGGLCLLTMTGLGFSDVAGQEIALEGTWSVTMATSVRRSPNDLEVLEEAAATLVLNVTDDGIRGRLESETEDMGPFVVRLAGTFRGDRLDLDPTEVEGPDVPPEFVGFYVQGSLEDGRLSGEMWGVVMRVGQERHHGPLPWEGRRQPKGR